MCTLEAHSRKIISDIYCSPDSCGDRGCLMRVLNNTHNYVRTIDCIISDWISYATHIHIWIAWILQSNCSVNRFYFLLYLCIIAYFIFLNWNSVSPIDYICYCLFDGQTHTNFIRINWYWKSNFIKIVTLVILVKFHGHWVSINQLINSLNAFKCYGILRFGWRLIHGSNRKSSP